MSAESGFRWTKQTEHAAHLVAEDKQTDTEIAAAVGVVQRTLERWKQHPQFQAKVSQIVDAYRDAVLTQGIADRVKRVQALNDRWERMQEVIAGRAKRYKGYRAKQEEEPFICTDFVPEEAETGTVILIETPTKNGIKQEWAVDTSLLSEMRATEKQAAIEVGEWEEKRDITSGGKPLPGMNLLGLSEISDEELERRIASAEGRAVKKVLPD